MRLHTWQKLQFESACGYDHIWGALCNDPVRRCGMNSITKVRTHSAGRAGGSSGRGPWLPSKGWEVRNAR